MIIAKTLVLLGLAVMAGALVYGFGWGEGWDEVRTLVAFPWFNVSLIDVYVGFALFGGWIAYREDRPLVAALWIVLVLALGNLVTCLYAAIALHRSRGDWRRFWLGSV